MKASLTVNTNLEELDRNGTKPWGHRLAPYSTVVAMCLYAMLCAKSQGTTGVLTAFAIGTITYLLSIYLYFGLARLAYQGHGYLLATAAVLAVVVTVIYAGKAGLKPGLTASGMVLLAGAAVGYLTRTGRSQQNVYIIGLILVALFGILQFQPLWKPLMTEGPHYVDELLDRELESAVAMGYGADALRASAESVRQFMAGMIRLIPALTILSAVMTFTVGYLLFAFVVGNETYHRIGVAPFSHWKMPLWLMPVFMAVIVVRLVGGEPFTLVADNVIVFLAFYYAVSGLALAEFFMRKLRFTRFMRIMLYILLFFTHLYGLILTAILGFIDSYADWRKIQQLSLVRQ